jgi:hypothetical protein
LCTVADRAGNQTSFRMLRDGFWKIH